MDPSSYFDLTRPDAREPTAYFVLDSLLRSRIDCGFESSADRHDEDVNVYLVALLSRLVGAPGLGDLAKTHDIEVFEQVRDSQDPRFKSRVYRTNADHLLVSTSLFIGTPYVEKDGKRGFDNSARDRIGRGKAYYRYAALFHERVPARAPALAHVLELLSEDFERYVDVLFHMRGEYFHLYERLRDAQVKALARPGTGPEETLSPLEALRNDFLDAYWAWHLRPDPDSQSRLERTVKRLKAADATFRFELPN